MECYFLSGAVKQMSFKFLSICSEKKIFNIVRPIEVIGMGKLLIP